MIEVVCGALIHDQKVMIAQRNYGSAKGKFEFPGGKVEPKESLQEALIREWKEECGIVIENIQFLAESMDHQEHEDIHLTCFVCYCSQVPDKPIVHSQFVWTTPEHIYDYDFFDSDKILVEKLKEKWPCLIKPMK